MGIANTIFMQKKIEGSYTIRETVMPCSTSVLSK